MLDFFRRHQRYFFLVITVVIIISFSFFGTYSTLGSDQWREQVAFTAVDGREVTRSDVDEMALFLATDASDKMMYGGAWGPNFLNDGVITKDFLETGLGEQLALSYAQDLAQDFDKRLAKEKKYNLYSHSQAPFVGVESVWSYFSPQMPVHFASLKQAQNGLDSDALHHRVKLYLGEKEIPSPMLRQILRYQEKQYSWLKPDDRLDRTDLSLFGYHTLEDWFGPQFTRLVSEFIINAAILAENQGYTVSKAEVLTDLVRNTQVSYQSNLNNPTLGVTSPEEYLSEQLRRLNMDQARAIKIWTQVLLFRRYFHDAGSNALVDTLMSQKIDRFANEDMTVDTYRLPASLRLANFDDLQALEVYLYAATKQNKTDPLAIPSQMLAVADIAKKYPELVQKNYVLEVSKVSQKALQAQIGLKSLWNWEVDEKNWPSLTKQFPTLAVKQAVTRENRLEAIDSLDGTTRAVVDLFAKNAIVAEHPEWIQKGLDDATPKKMMVGLRTQGGTVPFNGVDAKDERQDLIRLLDAASIGETVAVDSPLYKMSVDHQTYYRIAVLERGTAPEVLSFAEARSDGTLDTIRDRILEAYYVTIREKDPSLYKEENKGWKPLKEVRELVADQYFKKVMTALEPVQKDLSSDQTKKLPTKDQAAALRLYPYLNGVKEAIVKDRSQIDLLTKAPVKEKEKYLSLAERPSLEDQWKIEKETVTLSRQNPEVSFDVSEVYALAPQDWSAVKTPSNGDLSFVQVKESGEGVLPSSAVASKTRELQALLGSEAQRHLMTGVLAELKAKNALSLAYLKVPMDDEG